MPPVTLHTSRHCSLPGSPPFTLLCCFLHQLLGPIPLLIGQTVRTHCTLPGGQGLHAVFLLSDQNLPHTHTHSTELRPIYQILQVPNRKMKFYNTKFRNNAESIQPESLTYTCWIEKCKTRKINKWNIFAWQFIRVRQTLVTVNPISISC